MKIRVSFYKSFLLVISVSCAIHARAQFLVEMVDTTSRADEGLWAIYKRSDRLLMSGYFQPQFQVSQSKGAASYSGGDFATYSNSRFMIRRGRIRFNYAHFTKEGLPQAQVVFQFDGTEKGVAIRDFWGRFYENKWQLFAFTTGMFARPFGYEVNLSSSVREAPERGRMSQILMKRERDLGLMATLEPRKESSPLRHIKFDIGVFNGQGLSGSEEYDSYKDISGRIAVKPVGLSSNISLSGGVSLLEGGIAQRSRYVYRSHENRFIVDSSAANLGRKAPRKYRGVDAQLIMKNGWGSTQLRAEYWWGTQTATAGASTTPGLLPDEPYYIRKFNGAFFYLLQNIVNEKHQLVLKYDFYDPNTYVAAMAIGADQSNTGPGDIQYNTLGIGYNYRFNKHISLMLWYDMVKNESTALQGYGDDIRDNVFTCRTHFSF